MKALSKVSGTAYPFGAKNIDTDVIIAAEWLKTITCKGLGKGAFASLRDKGDTVFDDARYQGSLILIAGDNFGCGSSREHAAWAIADLGIKAIIAPSFSDIFSSNAFKNGIMTVCVDQAVVDRLMQLAADLQEISIDLDQQIITVPGMEDVSFEFDPFRKHCLLNGLDEVGLTLQRDEAISSFEGNSANDTPWLARGTVLAN